MEAIRYSYTPILDYAVFQILKKVLLGCTLAQFSEMSRWVLKKKNKNRSRTPPLVREVKPVIEVQTNTFRRQPLPVSKENMGAKTTSRIDENSPGFRVIGPLKDILKMSIEMDEKSHTHKDEKIYSDPWDLNCNLYKNQECCACVRTKSDTPKTKVSQAPKLSAKESNAPTNSSSDGNASAYSGHESDTGCELSDSGEESDYFEFLENIERRLKIDQSKVNSLSLPMWDSPFYGKASSNCFGLPFTKAVDKIIYKSCSDNSSGFFEEEKSPERDTMKNKTTKKQFSYSQNSELYSFPKEFVLEPKRETKPNKRTMCRVYQTGSRSGGNRLLGDLIQMNYEKQQLL